MKVLCGDVVVDVLMHLSERAFLAELDAHATLVIERFESVYKAGLIPSKVKAVSISYDFDVPTGVFRVVADDQLIVAIETPADVLASSPVQFNATWRGDCWHVTASDET